MADEKHPNHDMIAAAKKKHDADVANRKAAMEKSLKEELAKRTGA
jgi:hypothetical protein